MQEYVAQPLLLDGLKFGAAVRSRHVRRAVEGVPMPRGLARFAVSDYVARQRTISETCTCI